MIGEMKIERKSDAKRKQKKSEMDKLYPNPSILFVIQEYPSPATIFRIRSSSVAMI